MKGLSPAIGSSFILPLTFHFICHCHSSYPAIVSSFTPVIAIPPILPLTLLLPCHCLSFYSAFDSPRSLPLPFLLACRCHSSYPAVATPLILPLSLLLSCRCHSSYPAVVTPLSHPVPLLFPLLSYLCFSPAPSLNTQVPWRGAFCRSMSHYFNIPNINVLLLYTSIAPYFTQEKLMFKA
jgi:hypothetical protein